VGGRVVATNNLKKKKKNNKKIPKGFVLDQHHQKKIQREKKKMGSGKRRAGGQPITLQQRNGVARKGEKRTDLGTYKARGEKAARKTQKLGES